MRQPEPFQVTALEAGLTHLIEANAGTGKTYAIANLFLRYVLEGRRPAELLVVTFTRAATDELRGRLRARLVEALELLQGEREPGGDPFFAALPERHPPGEKRTAALARLEAALLEINDAAIHTIHGFSQQTLSDWAFSSGQAFDLVQADDAPLRQRALRDWWRRATQGDPVIAMRVLHLFGRFDNFRAKVEPLLQPCPPRLQPAPEGLVPPQERQRRLEELARRWREERDDVKALLLDEKRIGQDKRKGFSIEQLPPVFEKLDQALLGDSPAMPPPEALAVLDLDRIPLKGSAKLKEEHYAALGRLPVLSAATALLATLPSTATLLDDAARFVREQVARAKGRLGQIAFDDMIQRLHRALHEEEAGEHFAADLARAHPVVMVDEFQDTDPLQYAIFRRIHRAGRAQGHTLILIGDPKQAIYAFRGGDIFTYMQARHEADRHWSLAVNWRSTEEVIASVNLLFGHGTRPFLYDDIPYLPSRFPEQGNPRPRPLFIEGRAAPALALETVLPDGEEFTNQEVGFERVCQSLAARVADLLRPGRARLGEAPLQPADIAILVDTHREGEMLREALRLHGIQAVAAGKQSVWKSEEAQGLRRLLEAALQPAQRMLARQALAEPLLHLSYTDFHRIAGDGERWSAWVELLAETGHRWRRHGFMAAFHHLLQGLSPVLADESEKGAEERGSAGWLANAPNPERTLTNLLHLAELLQAASARHASGEELLAWMARQAEAPDDGEAEPRLESDRELVKIVTIFKSKGLQYPVVFLPTLWKAPQRRRQNEQCWHRPGPDGEFDHLYAPEGAPAGEEPLLMRERLGERIRKAYVALTRAESHCHLYVGATTLKSRTGKPKPKEASALMWLLSPQTEEEERHREGDEARLQAECRALIERAGDRAIVAPAGPLPGAAPSPSPASSASTLECATLERPLRRNWRIGSFSSMTRDIHQAVRVEPATGEEPFPLRYPAGANVGNLLHALLERLDPGHPIAPQIERMASWLFRRHAIGDDPVARDIEGLARWMEEVLATPLDETGTTLAGLDPVRTLRELDFDLGAGTVRARDLTSLLGEEGPALEFDEFQGMLTGTIDLLFERGGRYFIADYKSNLLGRTLEAYAPERLAREIAARRYDLQYLLYTVALHRHLEQRLPGYDYDRHFGGVYYLFLRAMSPRHGPRYGVHFARPEKARVERLDHQLIGLPEELRP